MLIYDTPKGEDRCTACGICAKVCPPQCIWIVRHKDANGKPEPAAGEFYIDASICMSCGFCAEYCPFDAIKMNHDYELAVYDRFPGLIYNMAELTVPVEYYASLYPTQFAEEEVRRAEEEAKKAKKPARGAKPEAKPEVKPVAAAAAPAAAPAAAVAGASALSAEELERRRAEAKACVAARKGEAAAPEAAAPTSAAPPPAAAAAAVAADSPFAKTAADPSKTSGVEQDEIARKRAESYARYQARKGADAKQLHGAGEPVAPSAAPAAEAPEAAACGSSSRRAAAPGCTSRTSGSGRQSLCQGCRGPVQDLRCRARRDRSQARRVLRALPGAQGRRCQTAARRSRAGRARPQRRHRLP